MTKHLTISEWGKLFPEAAKALCEKRAAVMPIDLQHKDPRTNQPVQTESRNLVFRLDYKRKRKGMQP